MNYDMKECGNRIHQLRIKSGLTQEQVAVALNIDRSFYSRIEAGKNSCSIDLFVQLSELFKVSLDYLILGKYSADLSKGMENMMLKDDIGELIARLERIKQLF